MTTSLFESSPDHRTDDLVRSLCEAGLSVESRGPVRRTLLDTFDRRLHRAGLVLELAEGDRSRLLLRGPGTPPVATIVTRPPTFASDLPAGPFRLRLAAVTDVRALCPVLTASAEQATLTRRNRDGKALVSVTVNGDLGVPNVAVELEQLAGYSGAAAKMAARLSRMGLRPVEGTLFDLVARATGQDIHRRPPGPTVPLDRSTPSGTAFAAVLGNLAAAVEANRQGTVDDVDPEFLHDLRVAVRRARVVVGEGAAVLDPPTRAWGRDELRWLAGRTSEPRDYDVLVLEWGSYVSGLDDPAAAALAPLHRHITRRRKAAHADLVADLGSPRYAALMDRWREDLAGATVHHGPDAATPIGRVVAGRLRRAHRGLVNRGRAITDATPAPELHELRKDAKRLRYILECFGGTMPAAPRKAFVQRMKVLQDNLGEFQDTEVHAAELARLGGELAGSGGAAGPTLVALGRLVEQLGARQQAARRQFASAFATYDSKETRLLLGQVSPR